MDFNLETLSPEDKLQKYYELNNTEETANSGYIDYVPNTSNAGKALKLDLPKFDLTTLAPAKSYMSPLITPLKETKIEKATESDTDGSDIMGKSNPYKAVMPMMSNAKLLKKLEFDSFENLIRNKESSNNPAATNKHSSAAGYYQFLWGDWGDSIRKVTGISSKSEFLKNPEAQKNYFKFYYQSHILPNVKAIKEKFGDKNPLSDFDLAQLIHFRGAEDAKRQIANGTLHQKKEGYNPSAMAYINRK